MENNEAAWRKISRFPSTRNQKFGVGGVLVALSVALFIAGLVTGNREVQTWAIIGIVPLICGITVLVSALRMGGK